MNITELRYLVAIKKWGSVSAAAKQLYAAQPNVSKALKKLEEEYGLRIFERSSTGMIPTEQGRRFIEQAARVLEEVDRLTEDAHHARERCAELRVMIPHATYASYAAVDFLKEAAGADQLRIHIREGGSMEALDFVLRRGYHLALLRYAAEDDDHYIHYCARRGLKMEPVMEFEYRLLTNRDGPLAKHEVKDLSELNHYMEIMHDDFQLPGEDGGDGVRWSTTAAASMSTSGAASFLSCSSCPQLICGPPPCPSGRWTSSIWCSKNAPPSVRSCGTCWSTPTTVRSGPKNRHSSTCSTGKPPSR